MIIHVSVKPHASENCLEKIGDKEYKAQIKAPADKNKANIELINLLAKHFNTSSKSIAIKNPTSRKKVIEIRANL